MRGLSTPNYGRTVRRFAEAYGIEKSTVSEQVVEASRRKLGELMERRLDELDPACFREPLPKLIADFLT